jgi:translocation and assembly module TamB
VSAYGLLTTERGSQWLLQKSVQLSGQKIELAGISGTLLSTLNIGTVNYKSCASTTSIKNLKIQWQPLYLVDSIIAINKLSAENIIVDSQNECLQPTQENFILPESITLPVTIHLDHLNINEIILKQPPGNSVNIKNISLSANTDHDQINIRLDHLDYDSLSLQSNLTTDMHQPYKLHGDAHWRYLDDHNVYQGALEISGDVNSLNVSHHLEKPYVINTVMTANDPLNNVTISSITQWTSVAVLFDKQQEIKLYDGKLKTVGSLKEIQYEIDTFIDTPHASNIKLSGKGTATDQAITLSPLNLQHNQTLLTARGNIGFAEQLRVLLEVTGKDINPAVIHKEYPGKLELETKIEFTQTKQQKQLQMHVRKLQGQLRDYPFNSSGKIQSDLKKTQLNDIKLLIGDNRIKVNGFVAKSIDLQSTITAPQLGQILKRAKGDLRGTLHIQGTHEHPIVNANLSSKNMSYEDIIEAQDINLTAEMDSKYSQAINARASLGKIAVQDQTIKDIDLNLTGTLDKHILDSRLVTQHGKISMSLHGMFHLANKHWQGTLEELLISDTQFGDWKNTQPAKISADTEKHFIDSLCMQQALQSICINYAYDGTNTRTLDTVIEDIELKNIQPYLRDYGTVQGKINGFANLSGNKHGLFTGTIKLDSDNLSLTPPEENAFEETLTFEKMQLSLVLNTQSNLKLDFISNYGDGSIQSDIVALQTIDEAEIIQGALQVNLPDLNFINPYIKNAVIKKGQATVSMQFSGPFNRLNLKGHGKIDQFDFYLPEFGTEYQDLQLNFDANNLSKINIDGKLNANNGYLSLKGWLSLDDITTTQYELSVVGDNFLVMDTIDTKASISPDLIIEGTSKKIAINGSLKVPQLNIILKKLPEEVDAVSDDEIILSDNSDVHANNKISMTGNIDVSLGEQASFTGYGLQTELNGGLKITLQEHQPTIGHGVLFMENAKYAKFGQVLDISKGNIIFSGPLDDPSLDIQIQRSNDITVTMLISGKAKDPQTKLTSNPSLSEANKLSYLLTGRLVNELNSGEGSDLTQAALALGLGQTSSTIQEIGTKFGLDTLSVEAGENGLQSTSLLLGKHLSPRLYITYAKDLFSAIGAIQMNYRLTDHISLEVESGSRQTVDLIYSITKE